MDISILRRCEPSYYKEEAEQTAHTLITNHRLFGLEIDGKLVSVAAKTRPTKNNITINFVYTPKEERKRDTHLIV